ncbi:Hypothetical predicted protein [Cloeon dipterum]|uniref:Uncharacterized protein n=1 Tax=Cloeon dipterum TaxID=197152 RepID=A0A8S1BNZ8_9INSE|nr:Hypothetical predicted protein [Cloeon dipterum]
MQTRSKSKSPVVKYDGGGNQEHLQRGDGKTGKLPKIKNSKPSAKVEPMYYDEANLKLMEELDNINDDNPKAKPQPKANLQPKANNQTNRTQEPIKFSAWLLIRIIAVLIVIAAIATSFMKGPATELHKPAFDEQIKIIRSQFPSQKKKSWITLVAGAYDFIDNTERPLIVLMNGYHKNTMNCLGRRYMEALNKTVTIKDAAQLQAGDYGEIVKIIKDSLEMSGGLLLSNLESLDAKLAMALHNVCDKETPLVKNSIVVITAGRTLDDIEKVWTKHIEDDKLVALVTRIRDRVITVLPEENLPCDLN